MAVLHKFYCILKRKKSADFIPNDLSSHYESKAIKFGNLVHFSRVCINDNFHYMVLNLF